MQSRREHGQDELFVNCSLLDLIPEEHLFRRVDAVLDLDWLHAAVADCYSASMGRPGIDPEAALRLMLAGFFEGIVHDRKLLRRAQTDIAFRWFAGFRLDERLPHHSSLTRIRQRWGAARFEEIFRRTVQCCVSAGLVGGETVHIDATLIRADVSWESLTTEHVKQVNENNPSEEGEASPAPHLEQKSIDTKPPKKRKAKKRSKTDPDASMTTSRKDQRLEPSFKQHTAADDRAGVIVDVKVTTGESSEGAQLIEQLERVESNTGSKVTTVTADASYAHTRNYVELEARGVDAVIPPQATAKSPKCIPLSRFKYDSQNKVVRCPGGKTLTRTSYDSTAGGWRYAAQAADCEHCPLRHRCVAAKAKKKTLTIKDGYEALLRARRRKARGWDERTKELYNRHRWRVEGAHGEAKTGHGLRRAARRGLENIAIQAYLTAAVMNLKRLAKRASGPKALIKQAIREFQRQIRLVSSWNVQRKDARAAIDCPVQSLIEQLAGQILT